MWLVGVFGLFFVFFFFIFFFNDTATTEIYTLSLHDALPIWDGLPESRPLPSPQRVPERRVRPSHPAGRPEGNQAPGPGVSRPRRPPGTRVAADHPAERRPAAAGGPRPRPRDAALRDPPRRAPGR